MVLILIPGAPAVPASVDEGLDGILIRAMEMRSGYNFNHEPSLYPGLAVELAYELDRNLGLTYRAWSETNSGKTLREKVV